MTNEQREVIIEEMIQKAKNIRQAKGIEYSVGGDINAAFNCNVDIGVKDLQTVAIFMDKHYRAIRSYVMEEKVLSEPIAERIADMINYLLIMHSIIKAKEKPVILTRNLDGPEA